MRARPPPAEGLPDAPSRTVGAHDGRRRATALLGIRTDSPPPDWDAAATLPEPPVRTPVPVLS
ncbi:hypothetical protein GCM10010424_16040 [Streptomyces lienomycini]